MPRRTRRDVPRGGARGGSSGRSSDLRGLAEELIGAEWAQVEGFEVRRSVRNLKRYRCPYCQGWILPGNAHLVVLPEGQLEERRHYHSPCWAKEAARRRKET